MAATGPPDLEYTAAYPVDTVGLRPPIAGFSGWWDASDASTISGGIGNSVGAWADKSGNVRTLTQATDGSRPWTGSLTQNERTVLFNPLGRPVEMRGNSPQSAQPFTVFTAGAQTIGDGTQRTMWVMRVAAGEGRLYRDASDSLLMYLASGLNSGRKWEKSRPHVVTSIFNGASSQIGVDGRYSVTGNLGSQSDTQWTIFGMPGSESWFGWIGEVVAYARLCTAPEIQRTEQYLLSKWGLA